MGVVFQFSFVLALFVFFVVLAPFRYFMRWVTDSRQGDSEEDGSARNGSASASQVKLLAWKSDDSVAKLTVVGIIVPVMFRVLFVYTVDPGLKMLAPEVVSWNLPRWSFPGLPERRKRERFS